jgi:peptidoglycan/LPS O-acetylase OafA/YrhL
MIRLHLRGKRTSKLSYRSDIQVLRGIAVISVVFYHVSDRLFPSGYLGVDVFFVVSGYVVTPMILRIFDVSSIKNARKLIWRNLINFYTRRFFRLAPAMLITLLLSIILIFIFAPVSDHSSFARQGLATLLLVGNFGAFFNTGDYFQPNPNPLIHTWSLSVEEQIFLFLPLIAILIIKKFINLRKKLILIYLNLGIISLIASAYIKPLASFSLGEEFLYYSPLTHIWQFTLGGLVNLVVFKKFYSLKPDFINQIRFVLVFIILFLLFSSISLEWDIGSKVSSIVTASIIIFKGCNILPRFVFKSLLWIGDRSYSIYLIHMPLIYLATYSDIFEIRGSVDKEFQKGIAVLLTILISNIMYFFVENRFRDSNTIMISNTKANFSRWGGVCLLLIQCFLVLDLGSKNYYWGLIQTNTKPAFAGDLDVSCKRHSVNGPPCSYPTPRGTKNVLLIGDSHGGDLSQAVIDAGHELNWNVTVWTHGGNLLQFSKSEYRPRENDVINSNRTLDYVMRTKPDAIILSQSVHVYDDLDLVKQGLYILKNESENVLLLYNRPVFMDNPFQSKSILAEFVKSTDYDKSVSINEMQLIHQNSQLDLASYASRIGFTTLDTWPVFCNSIVCSRYVNDSWLYSDNNHLSVDGAALLIPSIKNYLARLEN